MGHSNIYIRKDNESRWERISDKSDWVNTKLEMEPDVYLIAPAVAEKHPAVVEHIEKVFGKFCKHGADPKFCKFSKPGKPCK